MCKVDAKGVATNTHRPKVRKCVPRLKAGKKPFVWLWRALLKGYFEFNANDRVCITLYKKATRSLLTGYAYGAFGS